MRRVLAILFIPVVFLLIFSIYRLHNEQEPLTVNTFLNTLNQLDFDFDNTQNYISNVNTEWTNFVDNFSKPLPALNGDIGQMFGLPNLITEAFSRIFSFFQFLASVIFIVFGFLFDFILLFISIVKVLFSLLGFGVAA